MNSLPALNFVMLNVSDIEAAFKYYNETLGFFSPPEANAPTFRFFTRGKGGIDFGIRQAEPGVTQAGTVEVYFDTPDLEALRHELMDKEVKTTPIMEKPFGKFFVAAAPDQHIIMMYDSGHRD